MRKDASSIYYSENRFLLMLTDYNGADFVKWGVQLWRHGRSTLYMDNVTFRLQGTPHWGNLVQWIKRTLYFPLLRPDFDEPYCGSDFVAGAAFKLADEVKPFGGWPLVEKALESYHHGLRGTCSPWAHDGFGH